MCGISGWIDWEADLTKSAIILQRMGNTLTARGPDEEGYYFSSSAALAHKRLVVIDPTGGKQPMQRQEKGQHFVLVYNGELYNTEEIRSELLAAGYRFFSYSDTEVLLLAFIHWGAACLDKLNGIFAFGVWNETTRTLFLARDHLGVKPLFYYPLASGLLFASEPKSLLAHPSVKPVLTAEGLTEIFLIGPARTPGYGVFKGMYELKPGHYLVYSPQGLKVQPYWQLTSTPHQDNLLETSERVRSLFIDAVQRQLISDVPRCTLLSGGLDSTAITAIAARTLTRKGEELQTFSIDYCGNDQYFQPSSFVPDDDNRWIRIASEYYNTSHHRVLLHSEDLYNALIPALTARDYPGMADIDSSLLLFSQEIKKRATVGLSGECADEVFGGYPWFHRPDAIQANTFPWSLNLDLRTKLLKPGLLPKLKPYQYVNERYQAALAEVPRLAGESPEAARLREIAYLSLTRFMPTLLDRKDRMTMAASLEVRVPFCDHRLVQYAWNIPWELKNYGGQAKGILRLALKDLLPESILNRKKSPYPKTHNPRYYQLVRTDLSQILARKTSPLREIVDLDYLSFLLEQDPGRFSYPWFGQLMNLPQLFSYLIQINYWLEHYRIQLEV